jgi:hypothetical protein
MGASMILTRISTEFHVLFTGCRHFEPVGSKLWVELGKVSVIHLERVGSFFSY